jgi:phosphonate transport system substrate-binding protein
LTWPGTQTSPGSRSIDERKALAAHWRFADVDADFKSVFIARTDSGVRSLADVRGKRLALGSADSGQAAILPVHYLLQAGVDADRDCSLLRFDLDVGKHGDTGTSELEVLRALREGQADVGAIGDATWAKQLSEGRVDPAQIRAFWTSPGYCHCNFTVLADFPKDVGDAWTQSLIAMRYDDPQWRELMDLEGLKRWLPADDQIMKGLRRPLRRGSEAGTVPKMGHVIRMRTFPTTASDGTFPSRRRPHRL